MMRRKFFNMLGLVVFANNSGLGAQTKRLADMLQPDRILCINSKGFSQNKEQFFNRYKGFDGYIVDGFPSDREVRIFLKGLTHVLVCENPLNYNLLRFAKRMGIKVFIQSNYEFCDHLDKNLELPHMFLMPSYWKIQEMKDRFGEYKVMYLPPPIHPSEFTHARTVNIHRKGKKRFLHIVGTLAIHDRNGTLSLIEALHHSKDDYELVIRSQRPLPNEYKTNDKRVTFVTEDVENIEDMYVDFDALILPRRYAGLSLTTNEALMSAMPVIMSNVSPNNELLPSEWLVDGKVTDSFYTRTMIDVFSVDPKKLAKKIDEFSREDLSRYKARADEIACRQFDPLVLKPKYDALWI